MLHITAYKLNHYISDNSFTGASIPYIPASSLRGKSRQALTSLTDNIAPFEFKNDSKLFSLAQTGSGKSCFLGSVVIACFLLSKWKQTFRKFWTRLPNQEMAIRPMFEVFKEETTSYTSTHIAYPELSLEINLLSFGEDNPQMQTLTQGSERTDLREAGKSHLSSFLSFTYAPLPCFMHKCKRNSEEGILFSIQEINQELNNGKDVKYVGLPNYNSSFIKLLNSLKGIETSSVFQIAPVFDRELLSLYFFTDLIPARGLKQLFASSHHKFRFWIEIFGFFANWGLRLNKVLTIDYLKLINFSRLRGQSKNINLRGDVTKSLTLLKEENRQVLKNQSNLFGLAQIKIRRFADSLLSISKLLFRRFLIDKRCDFIFLVEMPL